MYQNQNGMWCRICPNCKAEIEHHGLQGQQKCQYSEKRGRTCRGCHTANVNRKRRKYEDRQSAISICNRRWYEKNKDKVSNYRKLRDLKKYNLTYEQVKQMYISQDGRCAICCNKFNSRRDMNIDHNHETGKVRQLLCRACNNALGFFKDNTLLLQRAIDYINKWDN